MGDPTQWLEGSPFEDYFAPSLILLVVGGSFSHRRSTTRYGRLINGLKAANIALDRKSLAELAVNHPEAFAKVAAQAAAAAPAPTKAVKSKTAASAQA